VVRAALVALLLAGGCTVDRSANDAVCDDDSDCPGGHCRSHLCVDGAPVDSGRDSGRDAAVEDAGEDDAGFDAEPVDASSCPMTCTGGLTCCDGDCVDITMDQNNCGRCGMRCPGDERCCVSICRDLTNDEEHCSGCNLPCNGTERCEKSQCCVLATGICRDP
jgi:hypothetical protein